MSGRGGRSPLSAHPDPSTRPLPSDGLCRRGVVTLTGAGDDSLRTLVQAGPNGPGRL